MVKIFKIEPGKKRMRLIDSQFFNNRNGFGYILRNLEKGDYQIHFKKYSQSFDVYDFTVKLYASRKDKFIDDEESAIKKVKLTQEMIAKIPKITSSDSSKPL